MSCVNSCFHCVFSTEERRTQIRPSLGVTLRAFLYGMAHQNRMKALEDFPHDSKRHGLQRFLWTFRILWEMSPGPNHRGSLEFPVLVLVIGNGEIGPGFTSMPRHCQWSPRHFLPANRSAGGAAPACPVSPGGRPPGGIFPNCRRWSGECGGRRE